MGKEDHFSKAKLVVVASAIGIALIASVIWLQTGINAENEEYDEIPRAAIIDQLQRDIPNEYFEKKVTDYLKTAGYEVDLYTTENITIDFYKKLPSMNYKFIVVRSHALAMDTGDNSVMLFSGEKYTTDKYIQEQLFGQVTKGTPLREQEFMARSDKSQNLTQNTDSNILLNITSPVDVIDRTRDEFFLVTPKLVNELMVGQFPSSIVVLGGCSTLENLSMAKPLIERGASSVIGWNDFVGSSDNDRVMLDVLEKILIDKMEPDDAVNLVMENYHLNPKYPAILEYYSGTT